MCDDIEEFPVWMWDAAQASQCGWKPAPLPDPHTGYTHLDECVYDQSKGG